MTPKNKRRFTLALHNLLRASKDAMIAQNIYEMVGGQDRKQRQRSAARWKKEAKSHLYRVVEELTQGEK